jgi:hypothetical protein
MKAGTVLKWNHFPFPRLGGEIKARWFICLGDTGKLSDPVFAHLCTTTTNLLDFEPGGKRERHTTCSFRAANTPFEEDCILDVDEGPYSITRSEIENNTDIEVKGEIGEQDMRMVYNRVVRSGHFSKREKLDIHRSFNDAGITGLKKP